MNLRHDPVARDTQQHAEEYGEIEQHEFLQEAVMQRAEEIAQEMITQEGYSENGVIYDMDDVVEHISSNLDEAKAFQDLMAKVFDGDAQTAELKQFAMKHAKAVAEDIAWREVG